MNETTSKIPAPPGYTELAPFNLDDYRGKGLANQGDGEFARHLNGTYLTIIEFFQAARSYPIVFVRDNHGKSDQVIPIALTGLKDRENLFVDEAGNWRPGCYVPAYIRRWPFFTARLESDPDRSLVCVDPAGLADSEQPFVDKDGKATELWQQAERLIQEMENARQMTREFTAALVEHQLLEPFEAHAMGHDGGKFHMSGMMRVNEGKLNALSDRVIRKMMSKGQLSRIYAHMVSLDSFQHLLDLRYEREQASGANTGG